MERDHFIIFVYCLVCEHFDKIVGGQRLRKRGFAPALSDEEVITLEVCGAYLGFDKDELIFDYFVAHYQAWFPQRKVRTSFVRQAANLGQVKAMIQRRLTYISAQAEDLGPDLPLMFVPLVMLVRQARGQDRQARGPQAPAAGSPESCAV